MKPEIREVLLLDAREMQERMKKWEKDRIHILVSTLEKEGIRLTLENIPLIIQRTSFAYRREHYLSECYLYSTKDPCHPQVRDLNCFLCSCPSYDSGYLGETKDSLLVGRCRNKSKKGFPYASEDNPYLRVWDCSDCLCNHSPKEIERYLRKNIDRLRQLSEEIKKGKPAESSLKPY